MRLEELLDLLDALDGSGATYWLDGGWGVDALLREQTRLHGDVDLVVHRLDLDRVRALLSERGYAVLRDLLPTAIAFRDADGREVDLHPIDPTSDGGGDQRLGAAHLPEGGGPASWHYGPPVTGWVGGRTVRCASATDQLAMHEGYEPRVTDRADVRHLAARFGLDLPAWAR